MTWRSDPYCPAPTQSPECVAWRGCLGGPIFLAIELSFTVRCSHDHGARQAVKPCFEKLYAEVENGNEVRRTLDKNSQPDYAESLQKELDEIHNSEMWSAGRVVRELRPENQ